MLSHVAILVTMRGRHPPCDKAIKWQSKNIESTDEAACLRIYHDINPDSENDPDVARLLEALGHMPFAVTLIAKLGVEGQSTAKDLLGAWLKSGPDIFSNNPEQSMNRSIRLSVDSDLVKRNPNAITLLAILSLLPAGTTKENLRWWAAALETSMIPSAIATLSQTALLIENKRENSTSPVLFVVPVVQSFMQQQHRIAEEIRKQIHSSCCEYVLAHACRLDDPIFPKNSKALAAEDTNIQSILFSSPPSQLTVLSNRTIEALIAFSWHRCDTKPNLDIINHAVTAAKASGVERHIASAVWCLGQTYAQLGDHHSSCDHLQEAYRLFKTLSPSQVESQESQWLGGQCGIDLVDTVRLGLWVPDKVISLAQDVEATCAALSDDVIHGRSLVTLGIILHEAQQLQEALRYLDQARTMLKAVGNNYNLAEACQIISWVHYDEGRFSEALDAIEEAWKHAKLSENASVQADIALDFGWILFSANRDTEAWEYTEISLMKASYVGDRFNVAHALEYMGYGYLRRGDYQNAYGAYEAAAENFLGTVDAHVAERCKDNMTRIEGKQENPDVVIGFYRPGIDVDQTLFYPPIQASASDMPIPVL
jgi:tetratricopeptide (TPR) repeat protein